MASQLKSAGSGSASGAGVGWTSPGNITSSDNTFAQAVLTFPISPDSNSLNATTFGFTIPTNSAINGIIVNVEKHESSTAGIKDKTITVVGGTGTSDNKASVSEWATSDTFSNYGSSTDLWGMTWTVAQINDAAFGSSLIATTTAGGTGFVDFISIEVFYSVFFAYTAGGNVICGGEGVGAGPPFQYPVKPRFVGWATEETHASTIISKPSNTINGDLMLAFVCCSNGNFTIATPSGWSLLKTDQFNGDSGALLIYSKVANNETGTYSWQDTGGGALMIVIVSYRFANLCSFAVLRNVSSTTFTAPSQFVAIANERLVSVFAIRAAVSSAFTTISGMTKEIENLNATDGSIEMAVFDGLPGAGNTATKTCGLADNSSRASIGVSLVLGMADEIRAGGAVNIGPEHYTYTAIPSTVHLWQRAMTGRLTEKLSATGSSIFGGAASYSTNSFGYAPTGNLRLGGAAVRNKFFHAASGGSVFGGSGQKFFFAPVAGGNVRLGGQASLIRGGAGTASITFSSFAYHRKAITTKRFYFSSFSPDLSPDFDDSWDGVIGADRGKLVSNKTFTALEDVSRNPIPDGSMAGFFCTRQFVSSPLYAQPFYATIKGQVRCSEPGTDINATLAIAVRIVDSSGNTRFELLSPAASDDSATPPEFDSSLINRQFEDASEATNILIQSGNNHCLDGDRICVELGFRNYSPFSFGSGVILRLGDGNLNDLPEDSTSTSDYSPWIEFSEALDLAPGGSQVGTGGATIAGSSLATMRINAPTSGKANLGNHAPILWRGVAAGTIAITATGACQRVQGRTGSGNMRLGGATVTKLTLRASGTSGAVFGGHGSIMFRGVGNTAISFTSLASCSVIRRGIAAGTITFSATGQIAKIAVARGQARFGGGASVNIRWKPYLPNGVVLLGGRAPLVKGGSGSGTIHFSSGGCE